MAGSAIDAEDDGANLAARYLRAVASRSRLADRYAIELAEAVFDWPIFRLALDVIDRERHTYSRATDLATAVLEVCGGGRPEQPGDESEAAEAVNGDTVPPSSDRGQGRQP